MNSQFSMLSLKGYEMIHPTVWVKKTDITKDVPTQDSTGLDRFV